MGQVFSLSFHKQEQGLRKLKGLAQSHMTSHGRGGTTATVERSEQCLSPSWAFRQDFALDEGPIYQPDVLTPKGFLSVQREGRPEAGLPVALCVLLLANGA